MADYLTRLVERTLQLSPTVRPEIPPTFAPEIVGLPPAEPEGPTRNVDTHPRTTSQGDASEGRHRGPRSNAGDPSASDAGGVAEAEHGSAGEGSQRDPREPRLGPITAPVYPQTPGEITESRRSSEPGAPEVSHREKLSTTGIPETVMDDRTGGHHAGAASARPAQRAGTHTLPEYRSYGEPERSEPASVSSPDRTETGPPPSGRGVAVSPRPDTTFPQVHERSVGRPAAPDHPATGEAWLEDPARPAEAPAEAEAREHTRAASGRTQTDSSSLTARQTVSEAPAGARDGRTVAATPRESVAPHRPEAAQRTPPPTVKVTIGRVEVRAISQAPEPAPQPVPGLSLDDYLRQYSGA